MPWVYRLIGASGVLNPGYCQNDMWLGPGPAVNPQQMDMRIIIEVVAPFNGVVYAERWDLHPPNNLQGNCRWMVVAMPANTVFYDMTINANAPQPMALLATWPLRNQVRVGNAAFVTGFRFTWRHQLRLIHPNLHYIPHLRRLPNQAYLVPDPALAVNGSVPCQYIAWGAQISQWRGASVWV
ncbi:hypothetical protein B0H16DRAFT_1625862 [Mycena metata]|uniref:Uncharacterized protein n=1 Tax=Mycena metata TaxID=1033252 RepID=A0AAD7H535_9AGAR|nr:hypothetical protein B0H16DRAFT_1625862 [Mycena metata]